MPLPASVREMHTDDVLVLLAAVKNALNNVSAVTQSDTLTLLGRLTVAEEMTGVWDQVVEISSKNRAGLDRLEAEMEAREVDGKETHAAILTDTE